MDRLAHLIRLVTGLGMVAAGTSLSAPAAIEIHRWWQAISQSSPVDHAAATRSGMPAMNGFHPAGPGGQPTEPPRDAEEKVQAGTVSLNRDYQLPPPPSPLPPVAPTPPNTGAGLAVAYRSTLEVPPPPLLDGQQPPPLAPGWSGRQPEAAAARPPVPAQQSMVYVIRDGDDLTGIATRFYGHPAAAAVIWEANRGLLPDPGILPIGATILLPHPDAIAGLTQVGPRAPTIEPAGGPGTIRAVGRTWP